MYTPRFVGGERGAVCAVFTYQIIATDATASSEKPARGSLRQIALAFLFFRFTVSAASLIIRIGMKKPPFSEPR